VTRQYFAIRIIQDVMIVHIPQGETNVHFKIVTLHQKISVPIHLRLIQEISISHDPLIEIQHPAVTNNHAMIRDGTIGQKVLTSHAVALRPATVMTIQKTMCRRIVIKDEMRR
jgi:hypothetical protein